MRRGNKMAELEKLSFNIDVQVGNIKRVEKLDALLNKLTNTLNKNSFNNLSALRTKFENLGEGSKSINKVCRSLEQLSNVDTSKLANLDVSGLVRLRNVVDTFNISKLKYLADILPKLKSPKIKAPEIGASNIGNLLSKIKSQLNNSPSLMGKSFPKIGGHANIAGNAIVSAFNRVKPILKSVGRVAENIGGKFLKLGATISRGIGSAIKNIGGALSNLGYHSTHASGALHNLANAFRRIIIYRGIRVMIQAISNTLREGISNFYQYSAAINGPFKASMDMIATSTQYASNSLGAMVAPIINALAPAIDYLISKFVALMNIINQFFARLLGGAKVFTRARKVAKSYGGAVGGAGKAAKKAAKDIKEVKNALLGIDELNIIAPPESPKEHTPNGAGGGGVGGGFGDMFEEVPIDKNISDFADKIKDAFNNGRWEELGQILGNKINEAIDMVDWASLGAKLGQGLDATFRTLYSFLDTIDWPNIGSRLSELLNNVMYNVDFSNAGRILVKRFTIIPEILIGAINELDWSAVAQSFADFFRGITDEINKFFGKFDLAQVGQKLGSGLSNAFNSIDWNSLISALSNGLNEIVSAVGTFVESLDLTSIGQTITEAFNTLLRDVDWYNGVKTICDGILEVVSGIAEFITTLDYSALGKGLSDAVNGLWVSVGEWLMNYDWVRLGQTFTKGLLDAISSIDWMGLYANVWTAVGGLITGVGGLIIGIFAGIGQWLYEVVWVPIDNWFSSTFNLSAFIEWGANVWTSLSQGISNAVSAIASWFSENIWQPISDWFNQTFSLEAFIEWGTNVIEGLKNGISSAISSVGGWLSSNVFQPFMDGFTGLFGIHSPSTVMQEQGEYLNEGLQNGLERFPQQVSPIMNQWRSSVIDGFKNGSGGDIATIFSDTGNKIGEGLNNGLRNNFETTYSSITEFAQNVIERLTGSSQGEINAQRFERIAEEIMQGFNSKIQNWEHRITSTMQALGRQIIESFTGTGRGDVNSQRFEKVAHEALQGFDSGVQSMRGRLVSSIQSLGMEIAQAFTRAVPAESFMSAASNVAEGFIAGLQQAKTRILSEVAAMGNEIQMAFANSMEIHSPSRAFKRFGVFTVQGFNEGLTSSEDDTIYTINEWANKLKEAAIKATAQAQIEFSGVGTDFNVTRSIVQEANSNVYVNNDNRNSQLVEFYQNNIEPILRDIANDTKRQADKEESTVLNVSGKEIAKAVKRQEEADGYTFI